MKKKTPAPIKPDVATYFIAKRMESVGMLRPGQALMLAATAGLPGGGRKGTLPPRPHFGKVAAT